MEPHEVVPQHIVLRILLGIINLILGFVELVLGLRILLKLLAANPVAPFVAWMYQTTDPLLAPFQGMFPSPVLTRGFVIEFSAVFALIAYACVGYFLHEIVQYIIIQVLGLQPQKPETPQKPYRPTI